MKRISEQKGSFDGSSARLYWNFSENWSKLFSEKKTEGIGKKKTFASSHALSFVLSSYQCRAFFLKS